LLVEVLNKKVVVTENGRRCKTTVREAVVTQLINKSATADLRATKMLLDLIKDAEKQTASVATVLHRRLQICAVFKGVIGTWVAAAWVRPGKGIPPPTACDEQHH
jgi:hypothetical protein